MDWSVVDSVRALSANDGLTFKIRSRIARKVSGEDVISEKWPFDRLHLNRISTTEFIQADITVTHLWKKRGWTACRRPRPNLSILKKLTRSIVSFIFRILWNIRIWRSDKNKNWHRWLVHTDYLRARNWFDSKKGKQLWQGKGWKQVFFSKGQNYSSSRKLRRRSRISSFTWAGTFWRPIGVTFATKSSIVTFSILSFWTCSEIYLLD